jgi:hypothetical protein
MRIYCPLCTWEPHPDDRWVCAPGCFTVWNTFETRARCPGCAKQWRFTACHACHVMSPHDEWYHDDALDEADRDEVEEPIEVGASAVGASRAGRQSETTFEKTSQGMAVLRMFSRMSFRIVVRYVHSR